MGGLFCVGFGWLGLLGYFVAGGSWHWSFRLILGFVFDCLLLLVLFVFRLWMLGFVGCCLFWLCFGVFIAVVISLFVFVIDCMDCLGCC